MRNKLGIRSVRQMGAVEFDALVDVQNVWFGKIGPDTRFTAEMICLMHREWLEPIYEWAGRYRLVNLAKGDFFWPPYHLIPSAMDSLTNGLLAQYTPCQPSPIEVVAERLAKVHAELLFIHPFRDGNGRLARWLSSLMAMQANYPAPNYGLIGKGSRKRQREYIRAVTLGYAQDYAALSAFFVSSLRSALSPAK